MNILTDEAGPDLKIQAHVEGNAPFFDHTIPVTASKPEFVLQVQRIVRVMPMWHEDSILTLTGAGAKTVKEILEQEYVTDWVARRRARQKELL